MTTKDKYIQKLEELIEHQKGLIDFFAAPDYTDVIILDLNYELSSLKAEMEKEEPPGYYPEAFVLYMSGDRTSKGTRLEDWYKHWLKDTQDEK